jgi:hypothetical protein
MVLQQFPWDLLAELVQRDKQTIRFAIQAALYGWWSSGSNSSAVLAQLIKDCVPERRADSRIVATRGPRLIGRKV